MRSSSLTGLLLAFVVAACTYSPAPVVKPNLDLVGKPPIALDVANIEVVDAYQPPISDTHADHLFPTPPLEAIHQWATRRLIGVGNSGTATITIKDASVTVVPLQKRTGIVSDFTTQADTRYDGRLEVEISINKPGGEGEISAVVTRSATTLEGIPLAEREGVWNSMTQVMIRDLDTQLETGLREHLAKDVVR